MRSPSFLIGLSAVITIFAFSTHARLMKGANFKTDVSERHPAQISMASADSAKMKMKVKQDSHHMKDRVFTVQIKSFASEDEAYEYAGRHSHLKGLRVVAADVNGKRWYRIYVGKSQSWGEIRGLREQLAGQLNNNEIFVKKMDMLSAQ